MVDRIRRLINAGVRPEMSSSEARRSQAIAVVALLAVFFNLAYLIPLVIAAADAFVPLFITNGISALLLTLVVVINARGHADAAWWLIMPVGPFNTVAIGLVMGIEAGGYLYILVLPASAVLMAPSGKLLIQVGSALIGITAFVAVLVIDPEVPAAIAETAFETGLLIANTTGTATFITAMSLHNRRVADDAEAKLVVANRRSERLLLNILPEEIADRLKAGEEPIADRSDGVTVLFADLVGSTPMSERLSADQMVGVLNEIFTPFDDLADELGLEKIKTVGDAYMVVGGLPVARPDHVEAVVEMALAMRRELAEHHVDGFGPLQMRFGIHTGPVVAGVIGKRKFSYDLWGDTVNTAARMESHGVPGEIQVTAEVMSALRGTYTWESRGTVEIKGKGRMETFFLRV